MRRNRLVLAALVPAAAVAVGLLFGIGSGGSRDARAAGDVHAAGPATSTTPAGPLPDRVDGLVLESSAASPMPPGAAPARRFVRATEGPDGRPVVPGPGSGAPDPSVLTGYAWPLRLGRITQPYGPSAYGTLVVGGRRFHDGIDIASFCGDHVRAAHDGVVLAAGRHYDDQLGWIGDLTAYRARNDAKKLWYSLPITIVVDDGNGYRSVYAHLNDIVVKAGQRVRAGEFIGWEGNSGNASGCHLHYGLFSPSETAAFPLDVRIAKKMKLPLLEIARLDPLRVLPPVPPGIRPDGEELTTAPDQR